MVDMHDKPVIEGARCRFYASGRDAWLEGVVRKVATNGFFLGQARVDDGDPENPDLHTNGFHVSAWVEPWDIEVLP